MKRNTMNRKMLIRSVLCMLCSVLLLSCEKNGLTAGDPDYWTTSRGQFTVKVPQGAKTVTMFFLNNGNGTATVTFDGSNPRHWAGESTPTVSVRTYADTIEVPATVNYNGTSLRVVAVGKEAFMGCDSLKKIVLPESITSIGEGAFTLCKSLSVYNIPSGVTELPSCAFSHCTSIEKITLPTGLKKIGRMAFYGCVSTKLQDVTIPASVQHIGALAFGSNSNSSIVGYYMKSTTPPALDSALYTAEFAPDGVSVYVPVSAVAAYQAAPNWKNLTIKADE